MFMTFVPALVASQWLGLFLQFIGVAMVTAVALIAVLEHHFGTVDPGKRIEDKLSTPIIPVYNTTKTELKTAGEKTR